MRFVYGIALAVLAVAVMGSVMPAAAQNVLDTPSVTYVKNSRSFITLDVQAGESGAPAGFVVEWIKKSDFDAAGGWPASEYDPRIVYCQFYGVPTLHESTGNFVLGPNGHIEVVVGNIFDETGLYANYDGELADATPYVIRVHAEGTADAAESPRSGDVYATTGPASDNCTYTIGFWKNHPEVWPVSSLTLGTVNYSAADLLNILNTPAGGNGLISLAHQLIGAKLSIANGADPTSIQATINAADALIGGLVIPPSGGGFLAPGTTSGLTSTLTDYNQGLIGPGHCGEVKATPATWGTVKGMYRK